MMMQNTTIGSVNDIIGQISKSEAGSHDILVYTGIDTFRELYSSYAKNKLKHDNEIILILPYYETIGKTREVLLSEGIVDTAITIERDGKNNDSRNKYEKEGSIIIKDSLKAYSSSGHNGNDNNNTVLSLIEQLIKKAENLGKDGVTIIADLGSFYHHNLGDTQKLVDYELSLPRTQYDSKKLKGLCVYHKKDFDKRFTEEQKRKLLQHHKQVFIVEDR
jgi:hypothetical protein